MSRKVNCQADAHVRTDTQAARRKLLTQCLQRLPPEYHAPGGWKIAQAAFSSRVSSRDIRSQTERRIPL